MAEEDNEHCPDCHVHSFVRRDINSIYVAQKQSIEKADNKLDKKLNTGTFFWIMGIVVTIFILIGSASWDTNKTVSKLESEQRNIIKTLEKIDQYINPHKE